VYVYNIWVPSLCSANHLEEIKCTFTENVIEGESEGMREIVLNAIGTNISRSRYMCIYVYVYICVPSLHSANHLEAIKCITMMGLVFRRLNRLQDALEWCRREVKVHMSHVAHMKES